MWNYILPAALPIMTAGIGILMNRFGKEKLFCFLFGVMLTAMPFFLRLTAGTDPGDAYVRHGGRLPAGTGFMVRIFSYICPDDIRTLTISALCAICAAVFIYSFCEVRYAGAVMFAVCGFVFCMSADISVYIAAILCLASTKFIYETRFFRFAAIILLAACFDIRALFMLAAFIPAQIKKPWITLLICAAAAVPLIMFPCGDAVFGLLPDAPITAYSVPTAAVVITAVFAALGTLIYRLFGKDGTSVANVDLLIFGCLAAAISYTDGRFAPLVLFSVMPALTALGSKMFSIGLKLTTGTFRNSRSAAAIWHIFCFAAAAAIYIAVISSGAFGISGYSFLSGEVI